MPRLRIRGVICSASLLQVVALTGGGDLWDHEDSKRSCEMLKSLEDNEREAMERWSRMQPQLQQPNGIACPECGNELVEHRSARLASNPPKYATRCLLCGYTGYRSIG